MIATIAVIIGLAGTADRAAADVLVTNITGIDSAGTNDEKLSVNDFAQAFTTGANANGYELESISIKFSTGTNDPQDQVHVYLQNNGADNRPSNTIATLTRNGQNYQGPSVGVNKYSVWKAECYSQPPYGGGCVSRESSVLSNREPRTGCTSGQDSRKQ